VLPPFVSLPPNYPRRAPKGSKQVPLVRERMPLLAGLALIAIAFVIGSIAIGHGIRDRNQNNVIVTGSAKKRITSDYVIWTLSVTSTQASATAAATELSGWAGKIRSFLTGQGVEPAELSVQPISTEAISKGGQVRHASARSPASRITAPRFWRRVFRSRRTPRSTSTRNFPRYGRSSSPKRPRTPRAAPRSSSRRRAAVSASCAASTSASSSSHRRTRPRSRITVSTTRPRWTRT
jgi:Protein of unknown function (DUF541)